MSKNNSGPYLAACGHCAIPLKVHQEPQKYCPYIYEPIVHNGRLYGYKMIQKKPDDGVRRKSRGGR